MNSLAVVQISLQNLTGSVGVEGVLEVDRTVGVFIPPQVADAAALLALTPEVGEMVWQQDTEALYRWDGAAWQQVSASLVGTVPDTRRVIAGSGLTGGGALSSDITLDVVAGDGSIVVTANSIEVGIIGDAQHGTRGGGALHAEATGLAAGFMGAADKTKLDAIEAGATADQVAAEVPFTPNGDIAATDVQAAIQEVRDDTDTKIAAVPSAPVDSVFGRTGVVAALASDYDAVQVDFTPDGDIVATDVQAAIVEVRDDTDTKLSAKADTADLANYQLTSEKDASGGYVGIDGSGNVLLTGNLNLTTGNVSVAGSVDGRDVSVDGTKLDGIEAGATADQTITAGTGLTGGGTGDVTVSADATVVQFRSEKGQPNGYAELDGSGQVPLAQLPTISSTDELVKVSANDTTEGFLGTKLVAGSNVTLTEINDGGDETLEISASGGTPPVDSVFGRTGAVVALTSDYDASQVDNDSAIPGATVADALNTLGTGRAAFAIWAEENASLSNGAYEWAFGNGDDTANGSGVVVPFDCFIFALGLDHNTAASATVAVDINGTNAATITTSAERSAFAILGSPVAVSAGDVIGFQTITGPGSSAGNRIVAYLRTTSDIVGQDVDSVFGRTGAIVALAGDYDADQIDFTPNGDITSTDVQAAIQEVRDDTDAKIAAIPSGVDERVKVSANDTFADFLANKFVSGANISITEQNDGSFESLLVSAVIPDTDRVSVSANDTSADYLVNKLTQGTNITVTELNDGGFESAEISAVPFNANETPFLPTATIAATDVQAAIEEVDAEHVDPTEHNTLRQHVHFADGPSIEFGSGLYRLQEKDTLNRCTAITWYTDNTATVKVYEQTFAYDTIAGIGPASITTTIFEADGTTVAQRYTDTITYEGGIETSRFRRAGLGTTGPGNVTQTLRQILPATSHLWTADSMAAFDDAEIKDQVNGADLGKITTDPTSLGASATFNGEKTLVVPATGGGYQDPDLFVSGPVTTIWLGFSNVTGFHYIQDGAAATQRLFDFINTGGGGAVTSGWVANSAAGAFQAGVPVMYVGRRTQDGSATSETFVLRDGLAAVSSSLLRNAGPFAGYTLNSRYTNIQSLNGEWVFSSIHRATLTRAQINYVAAQLNALFNLSLGLLP